MSGKVEQRNEVIAYGYAICVSIPLRGNERKRREAEDSCKNVYWFPSPCGEMSGKDLRRLLSFPSGTLVSIPLRGNERKSGGEEDETAVDVEFPSPCGEMSGKGGRGASYASSSVSIPLRGNERKSYWKISL